MSDCRYCRHYSCEEMNKNNSYIIQVKCCVVGGRNMMDSLDCPKYEPIEENNL